MPIKPLALPVWADLRVSAMIATQAPLKDHILRLAQKLPASPQIFGKLCLLLDDLSADAGQVVDLISVDASLSARVLRLSNSVFFAAACRFSRWMRPSVAWVSARCIKSSALR